MMTHEEWLPIIKEYEDSSMSISGFCKSRNISYDAFYWHYKKGYPGRSDNPLTPEIIPVVIETEEYQPAVVHMNGVEIAADIPTLQKLLGIRL